MGEGTGPTSRLRHVDPTDPGLTRRRRGRGFTYYDADGRAVTDPVVRDRIRALVLPPAWTGSRPTWGRPWGPRGRGWTSPVDPYSSSHSSGRVCTAASSAEAAPPSIPTS
ncbi:hypothetical protein [Embleya sp. NPDC050493]|uniref:hypothetical protein n=1 Tax=Embleya sp. NPDC050493 TaxID=3363989 RepID=UPI0037BC9FD9